MEPQAPGILATIAGVLGLSFASGVNLYAAVLTVGLSMRFGWLSGLPPEMDVLSHPAVLGLAAVMYLAEFVADKIPYFTPIWDAIHTVIRPIGGAMLAMQAAGNLSPLAQALATLVGGSIALGAHSGKAGFRLLAHATPEPTSHSIISVAEDFGVVTLVALAYNYPEIAVIVVICLLVLVAIFTPVLLRVLRFVGVGLAGRFRSWTSAEPPDSPAWLLKDVRRLELQEPPHIIRCFTRSGSTVSRLRDSYLVRAGDQWWLIQRRMVGDNIRMLSDAGLEKAEILSGIIWDVLRFTLGGKKRYSYYVTKDWSKAAARMTPITFEVATSSGLDTPPQAKRATQGH